MTTQNTPTTAKRLAQIVAGLNIVIVATAFVLSIGISSRPIYDIRPVSSIVYSVLAVLIISRHPRNTVGWLFLVVGFFSAVVTLDVGLYLKPYISSELVHGLVAWVGHLAWIPAFMIPITLVLQFFPDGRLPSRRWWPITAATLMGMCGFIVSFAFYPWPWETQGIFDTNNPFGIVGSEGFFEVLFNLSIFAFAIGMIGSLVAVVVRFTRSQGVERIQMKWLVYTAVIGISAMLLSRFVLGFYNNSISDLAFLTNNNPISDFIFLSLPILLAIAIGIAILRYRLFDIDIIIRRTLQYTLLTAILALIYFGLVVTFQGIFSAAGNQQSPVIIVISTLVIAGLFNPLRIRIQNYIDRRFYRKKYHAEQALAKFAATARDEVDMDKITIALLEIVQETMQPKSVGLWLVSDKT
jgi:hypothetical protein